MKNDDRVYRGLTKETRIAKRRQQFIDAGIELFGTQGYHAVTVRKLCSEAGLTARYFYESFENNEDLLIAAFDQCMLRITAHIKSATAESSVGDDPRMVINGILDAFLQEMEDKRVARLIMLEVLGVGESVDKFSNSRMQSLGDVLLRLGHLLYPNWKINKDEGALLSASLLGAMRQATIHWMVNDYAMDRKAVVKTTALLVFGLLAMIEETTGSQENN